MQIKRGGGFTLAELLIVMAIIVVLAAVAVPTFGRQLETSRETGDMELIRNAYTEALSMAILDGADGNLDGVNGTTEFTGDVHGVKIAADGGTPAVYDNSDPPQVVTPAVDGDGIFVEVKLAEPLKQTETGWQYVRGDIMGVTVGDGTSTPAKNNQYVKFKFNYGSNSDGSVKLVTSAGITLSAAATLN